MKKQKKPFTFRGKILLPVVFVGYCFLFFSDSSTAFAALLKSGSVLLKILPIIAVVILFTALINFFLQPKQMAKHLGREGGIKGWLWALFAGLISHGPMYVWFPMLEDLRGHGMRDGLIVVFFAARTIKIPLLPMMIDYFGWMFTLILSFYILIGAVAQGWLLERVERK